MAGRGWWIAAAGGGIAVILWFLLAMRGPASGRAPARSGGARAEKAGTVAEGGAGSLRVTVRVEPEGSLPEWVLSVRQRAGGAQEQRGSGEQEREIGPLPAGSVRCSVGARGYVGETRRLEVADKEIPVTLTLRQFGRVSGVVRCEGAPVAGVLVRLAMPIETASIRTDLVPEDQASAAERSVETDSSGAYRFEGVPPGRGFTLGAAGFDHPPVDVGPFDVKPGEETKADVALKTGAHLAGRIIDARGAPCLGGTVNVLEYREKGSIVGWVDEARARTDEGGRFLTPALRGTAPRMLKAWIVVDGVHQVIQHETSPPEQGTKDVGTLAPHPGIVQFELEEGAGDPPAVLTVAVHTDPPDATQSVVLAGIAFGGDGRIRLAGLPAGEGAYTVVSGDDRAVGNDRFRVTGSDIIVRIPPLMPRERDRVPEEQLVVDVAETTEPVLLLLLSDGSFVMGRWIEKGAREPIAERVAPGRYTLLVCAGDRYGRQEITQTAGRDMRVSAVADRIGRSVSVLVLNRGKPLPGAVVQIRGFTKDSRGARVPWEKTGDDGRALLRGLPPDVTVLETTVWSETEGIGRGYTIDVDGKDEATVDLAKPQGHD